MEIYLILVPTLLPWYNSKKEDDGTSRMFRRPPRLGVYGDDLGWPKILSVFGQHEEGVISSTG